MGIQVNGSPVSIFVKINFVFNEYSIPVKWALYKHAAIARPQLMLSREKKPLASWSSSSTRVELYCQQDEEKWEREKTITILFDKFNNGELSLDDFLEAVKHQTGFKMCICRVFSTFVVCYDYT